MSKFNLESRCYELASLLLENEGFHNPETSQKWAYTLLQAHAPVKLNPNPSAQEQEKLRTVLTEFETAQRVYAQAVMDLASKLVVMLGNAQKEATTIALQHLQVVV